MSLFRPGWKKDGVSGRSRHWWFEYRHDGKRIRVNTKKTEKRAAEKVALEILKQAEMPQDPFTKQAKRTLTEHLADFETGFRAKEVREDYREERLRYLREFFATLGGDRLSDLDGTQANLWLTSIRETGVSARTVNKHRAALVQFGRWLVRERRLSFDPFVGLKSLNEEADRRHVRRALTEEQFVRLLEVARTRPLENARKERVNKGVTEEEAARLTKIGETRALIYSFAAGTGLRHGECRRVRWCDLDFERRIVNIPAASAKSRRNQFVPLRDDLVERLKSRRGDAAATDPVFPSEEFPTLRTYKLDLVAAGIARKDENGNISTADDEGRIVDFHALRTTFASSLAKAGVHPRAAQALMRHSSVELTMKAYTDVRLLDLRNDVERIAPGRASGRSSSQKHAKTKP
ncbi:MAG TPA: tyrosine-type recombinase/integrase [Planctomycetota bacterium]|nr:tyrosine-type recombinase/integrase [Planctomycetota bacterium]